MSNRAATTLAIAAVISSLWIYATFAQAPEPENGAIVAGPPPIRLQQELPGRYQLKMVSSGPGSIDVVLLDTHTGQCWYRSQAP